MRVQDRYYDVSPKIVRAGRESDIMVRPKFDHCRFKEDVTYQAAIIPAEGYEGQTAWGSIPRQHIRLSDGALSISYMFEGEQEYVLLIESSANGESKPVADFRLYALDEDLFSRRPFKGDIHMHSSYSDGKESPAFVTASCRRIGLDFMAVTDHRQYAPSLEAIKAFEGVDTDLRIYPGEEIHPPDNPVHIINFGGRFSINELFGSDEYMSEVKMIEEALDLPSGVNRYSYASCLWCYRKIREAGGLGLFCHPYWFTNHRYDVPGHLTDLLIENQPYDALELIGGYFKFQAESNTLQVARYQEERAKGKKIPVVGVSDAHGCEQADLFGWYYTIVFASSTELADLIMSIKDMYSVAVEALPGETVRAYGPFRLARYSQYLLREIFPLHDELCAEEGRLMLAHVEGDPKASGLLAEYKGRMAALYERLWGGK